MHRYHFNAFFSLIVLCVLAVSGCVTPGSAPAPTPTPTAAPTSTAIPPAEITEADAVLGDLAGQSLFTGSVLIARQGQVLLSRGYGLADRQRNTPNTPQTRFRLGSVTKQFTAMAILILENQGKLNIQDPICTYIPDCPPAWGAITIKHLLTHTSGIPDFTLFADYLDLRAVRSTPLQVMARFKDRPLDFQPGEKFSYSNSGYVVLGYIIEQASGQTYEDFLQGSIFTPLNMHDTGYDHLVNGLAVGYPNRYSTHPADFIDMSIPYSAGGLYSTVEDLYRWDQSLYTEQLVPKAYLDEMFAPQVGIAGSPFSYGYGWAVGKDASGLWTDEHDGGIEGFATVIARYPDDQVTIIILSNQQDVNPDVILDILSRKVFGIP